MKTTLLTFANICLILCLTLSAAHASHGDYNQSLYDDDAQAAQETKEQDADASAANEGGDQKREKEAANYFCSIEISGGFSKYKCSNGMSYVSYAACKAACN